MASISGIDWAFKPMFKRFSAAGDQDKETLEKITVLSGAATEVNRVTKSLWKLAKPRKHCNPLPELDVFSA